MYLFNLPTDKKPKQPESIHPWKTSIKEYYINKIRSAHNSIKNVVYPKPKERIPNKNRVTFSVFGNRVTKEFIYCVKMVQGMHKYRWKNFDTPVIKGYTGVEWPDVWHELKLLYGSLVHFTDSQVIVLCNDEVLGGEKELKDLKSEYIYHLTLHYQKDSVSNFAKYLKCSGRPCVYMHISLYDKPIGPLIFMLYSDVTPVTWENFLRLCRATKGGYSGTPVHRIVKDGWIQCGGFGLKDTKMNCENFIVPHNRRGVLGMANADRHVDCSTQFYVLLRPNEWLQFKYVAFGQLIEGEKTLQNIEEIETVYEAPTANITIIKAGILNLDCKDIAINKHTLDYLGGHIDDLITIGEMFYEMLIDRVFLELEFKTIQSMKGEEEEDSEGIFINKHIRATRRFQRKKEEIADRLPTNNLDTHNSNFRPTSATKRHTKTMNNFNSSIYGTNTDAEYIPAHSTTRNITNNDFATDECSFELEHLDYTGVTPFSTPELIKSTKPYYIALTDVPYLGEVDSNFNLKRMLRGDYCLESDLETKLCKKPLVKQKKDKIIHSHASVERIRSEEVSGTDTTSTWSSLDSDEVRNITEYLSLYAETVSFTGNKVSGIASQYFSINPLENKRPQEKFTDEDLRIIRQIRRLNADDEATVEKEQEEQVEPKNITRPHEVDKHKIKLAVSDNEIQKNTLLHKDHKQCLLCRFSL